MPDKPVKPLWPEAKPRRFPLYLTVAVGVLWAVAHLAPLTRDYRVVASQVAAGVLSVGLLGWFTLRSRQPKRVRWSAAGAAVAAVLAVVLSVRFQSDGDGRLVGWRFRWEPLPDRVLPLPDAMEPPPKIDPLGGASQQQPSYPGFLGGRLWAEVDGVQLADDWEASPPEELWRQPIGAGWSAFAIADGLAITQEQRDEQELVVAYRVEDGTVAWFHGDAARFDPFGPTQRMGGVGPRATPTIHDGRVYTHGATGIVNCLDAATGSLVWSRDTLAEFDAPNVMWGKSGSPLVLADKGVVVVSVGTAGAAPNDDDPTDGASLVAMDLLTGETRWTGGGRMAAYATPAVGVLAGREQVLQVNHNFLTAHDAATGRVLWEFPWPGSSNANASCSQPIPLPGDRVFLSKGYAIGSVMLRVAPGADGGFSAEPVWQSRVMKTKFGNVVLRDSHAYGIDGVLLQCIDLETGKSRWKRRRRPSFGHGQLMLVGDRLLILTEWGELVLADASPDGYRERASLQVFDDTEVTWNNPALAGPFLLVRNATEAVGYRLPLVDSASD